MSFSTDYDLATNGDFQHRIEGALLKVSLGLLVSESATQKSKDLALIVVNGVTTYVERFAKATVFNPETVVTNASTDSDIEFTVGVVFSKLAGG